MESKADDKKKSYSVRLADYFVADGRKTFEINEIQSMIKDFCKIEYDKIKARSDVMPFGRYKGKSVKVLCEFDRGYVDWLLDKQKLDNYPVIKRDILKYIKT